MTAGTPDFSIVTPSFNALAYLPRCAASIADQHAGRVEHLVMDGGSTDGTAEWLRAARGIAWVSERDRGMYDAINKGLRRAQGRFLAYLSADEQYLEGTLAHVRDIFERNPAADFVHGGMLTVGPDGSLVAFRRSYPLRWPYVAASHLYAPPCALFFRRKVVDEGVLFDPSFRDTGDAEFVVRMLRRGYRGARASRFLAAFTLTGKNMSAGENARRERAALLAASPAWVRALRGPINLARLAEKAMAGAYRQGGPIRYSLYVNDADRRSGFTVERASFRWSDTA